MIALIFGFTIKNKINDSLTEKDENAITEEDETKDINNNTDNEELEKVKAPNFKLKTLDGKEVSLSDYQGKYVWINFWATWCPYCVKEMPDLQKIYEENSDELVILAIDVGEDKETVEDYLKDKNYTFPILLDYNQEVAETYFVSAYPTTYFIDKEGYLIGGIPGMMTYPQMEQIFNQIKGE